MPKYSKSTESDFNYFDNGNSGQIIHTRIIKDKIQAALNNGVEIEWSQNEQFCVIDGETFNVSKKLFEQWLTSGELVWYEIVVDLIRESTDSFIFILG